MRGPEGWINEGTRGVNQQGDQRGGSTRRPEGWINEGTRGVDQ